MHANTVGMHANLTRMTVIIHSQIQQANPGNMSRRNTIQGDGEQFVGEDRFIRVMENVAKTRNQRKLRRLIDRLIDLTV